MYLYGDRVYSEVEGYCISENGEEWMEPGKWREIVVSTEVEGRD